MCRPSYHSRRFHYALLETITTAAYTTTSVLALTRPDRPPIGRDGLFFQYVGRSHQLPYRDIWDLKPPLMHAVSNGLATVTTNPTTLHYLSVALMAAVAITIPLLLALLVEHHTNDTRAGVIAGLAWLIYPTAVWLPVRGLRPKPFVLLFGLGALVALARDRRTVAVAAGTIAAGFWQLGIIFPAVALWAGRHDGRRALAVRTSSIVAIALVTISPYLRPDAVMPMLLQVLGGPLVTVPGETTALTHRVTQARDTLALAATVPLAGVAGYARRGLLREHWPLAAVTVFYTLQVAVLDYDGPPDLLLWYAGLCLGVGLAVDAADLDRRVLSGVGVLAGLAVLGALLGGPAPGAFDTTQRVAAAYWHAQPVGCHVQQSPPERLWMRLFDETTQCGPYRPVRAIRRLLGVL